MKTPMSFHRRKQSCARLLGTLALALPGCFEDASPLPGDDTSSSSGTAGTSMPTTGVDSTTIDPDTTATDPTTADTTATTGPPPACDEPDGTFGGMCAGTAPFCVAGECVPCSSEDPLTTCNVAPQTVCDPSGECVVCSAEDASACTGDTPVCDSEINTCVPCTEHEQCGASACNLFTGACVGGMVVTVGAGQNHSTLAAAVSAVGSEGTIIVFDGAYNEAVTVGGGALVAFLANDGDEPQWQRTTGAGAPQLRSTGGATVLIDGIDVRSNNSSLDPAIRVDGASLWVDRSTIAGNAGVAAVRAEGSGEVVLRNCFVGGATDRLALNSITGSNMTVEYSTVVAAIGESNAILCDAGSGAVVSDSIILTRGGLPEVDCPMLTATNTAANTELAGSNNAAVGSVVTAWFTSYAGGDFHLSASGQTTFMNIAEWNIGDPTVDIDGMPRSGVDGAPEHAGADLP